MADSAALNVSESPTVRAVPRSRADALTGVRFAAALYVFLFHYGAGASLRAGVPGPIVTLLHHGYFGVSMFFILSGFILTYSYLDRMEGVWIPKFFIARFARIYPVYIFALVLMLPVLEAPLSASDVAHVLTLTQSWTSPYSAQIGAWIVQAWTLSVEAFFYLLFPLFIYAMRPLGPKSVAAVLVLCWAGMVLCATPAIPQRRMDLPFLQHMMEVPLPVWRLFEFVAGMALCRLMFFHQAALSKFATPTATAAVLVLMLITLATAPTLSMLSLSIVFFSILIVMLALGDNFITRFLSTKTMLILGGASYGFYILQYPTREILRRLIGDGVITELANPIALTCLSVAAFLFWERPLRRAIVDAGNRVHLAAGSKIRSWGLS